MAEFVRRLRFVSEDVGQMSLCLFDNLRKVVEFDLSLDNNLCIKSSRKNIENLASLCDEGD